MIKIKYFAALSETLGVREENLENAQDFADVNAVVQMLISRGEPWAGAFVGETRVLVAINHEICAQDAPLNSGDELAFFPPVTGG